MISGNFLKLTLDLASDKGSKMSNLRNQTHKLLTLVVILVMYIIMVGMFQSKLHLQETKKDNIKLKEHTSVIKQAALLKIWSEEKKAKQELFMALKLNSISNLKKFQKRSMKNYEGKRMTKLYYGIN